MLALTVFGTAKIGRGCLGNNQFVAVTRLMGRVQLVPGVQRLCVPVSTYMPVSVRARHPCSQQGYTDQEGDSRGCLAEALQHCWESSSATAASERWALISTVMWTSSA